MVISTIRYRLIATFYERIDPSFHEIFYKLEDSSKQPNQYE